MSMTAGLVSLSLLFSAGTPHPLGMGVGGSLQMALADDSIRQGPRIIGVAGVDPLIDALITKDLSACFSNCGLGAFGLVEIGASAMLNADDEHTSLSAPNLWLSGVAQVTPMVTYH